MLSRRTAEGQVSLAAWAIKTILWYHELAVWTWRQSFSLILGLNGSTGNAFDLGLELDVFFDVDTTTVVYIDTLEVAHQGVISRWVLLLTAKDFLEFIKADFAIAILVSMGPELGG